MDQLLAWTHLIWGWVQPVVALLATFGLALTAIVATAWATFWWLGDKWMENKFAKSLERYKADQAQELERLRHRINSAFDRMARLRSREFEVLPELWRRLVAARGYTLNYISPGQSYPSIEHLDEAALREFLDGGKFLEWQKKEIMDSPDKKAQYIKTFNRHRSFNTYTKLGEFDEFFRTNSIFLGEKPKQLMDRLFTMIHRAVIEQNMNEEYDVQPRVREASQALYDEGEKLFAEIERTVASLLWETAKEI
jgi:hypothetical protein